MGSLCPQAHSSGPYVSAPTVLSADHVTICFAAGHHNYARYISWYVRQMQYLPHAAKLDLLKGAHVCRHPNGGTAVPADQFGEQTYIKRGKGAGGMKGISTITEQVAVWVNSFSVCSHLDIAIEQMYNEQGDEHMHGANKHKEEGEGRWKLDETDRRKVSVEFEKHSHPLNEEHPSLYSICNGQVAPDTIDSRMHWQ